jgi:predicted signal transduction protein with EAL and GGDEF domain
MADSKIDVTQARHDVEVSDALLVCAYDDQEKFEKFRLADAISLDDLGSQEDSLSKERELIFYCA